MFLAKELVSCLQCYFRRIPLFWANRHRSLWFCRSFGVVLLLCEPVLPLRVIFEGKKHHWVLCTWRNVVIKYIWKPRKNLQHRFPLSHPKLYMIGRFSLATHAQASIAQARFGESSWAFPVRESAASETAGRKSGTSRPEAVPVRGGASRRRRRARSSKFSSARNRRDFYTIAPSAFLRVYIVWRLFRRWLSFFWSLDGQISAPPGPRRCCYSYYLRSAGAFGLCFVIRASIYRVHCRRAAYRSRVPVVFIWGPMRLG